MKKIALLLALLPSLALAQTCPTRLAGDNSNACASTAFVQTAVSAAVPVLPSAEIFVGNSSNMAAAVALSGDCTISNIGLIACTKTNGTVFATLATKVSPVCSDLTNASASCSTDATNASNISSGTLNASRLPAFGSADVSCLSGGGACTIAANAVTDAKLAAMTQNAVKGAATSTAVADLAIPSCSSASSALTWTTNTGFGCNSIAGGSGALISVVTYSSTQTITIPGSTTKAFIRMWGGSGGSGGCGTAATGNPDASGGVGAAGYLEKYLTSLTAGNTLAYTQGAAGAAGAATPTNGGNGTASTLASGTQSITTLTANGSNGSLGAGSGVDSAGTVGGTATNGDVNITGQSGTSGGSFGDGASATFAIISGIGGASLYAPGPSGCSAANGSSSAGTAGRSGGLVIFWFSWNLVPANDNFLLAVVA